MSRLWSGACPGLWTGWGLKDWRSKYWPWPGLLPLPAPSLADCRIAALLNHTGSCAGSLYEFTVYMGLPLKAIWKLKEVQNAATRLMSGVWRYHGFLLLACLLASMPVLIYKALQFGNLLPLRAAHLLELSGIPRFRSYGLSEESPGNLLPRTGPFQWWPQRGKSAQYTFSLTISHFEAGPLLTEKDSAETRPIPKSEVNPLHLGLFANTAISPTMLLPSRPSWKALVPTEISAGAHHSLWELGVIHLLSVLAVLGLVTWSITRHVLLHNDGQVPSGDLGEEHC